MSLTKSLLIIGALGVIGAFVFFSLYPDYSPRAAVDLQVNRPEILETARGYLHEMGYDTEGLDADANFRYDSDIALYLEAELGYVQAHQFLRADTLFIHDWHVYFFNRKLSRSQMPHRYHVWLTPSGNVFGFEHIQDDSVAMESVEEPEALALAKSLIQEQGVELKQYTLKESSVNQLANRKDYFFQWTRNDSIYGMSQHVWVRVQGSEIGGFRIKLDEPEEFRKELSSVETFVSFIVTGSSIATFFLLIFVISLFLKKYHEGEVGVKTGIIIFAVLFGLILVEQLLSFTKIGYQSSAGDLNRFYLRIVFFVITVFIIQAFLASMGFAAWSVGESSARRGWGKKVSAIDGLLQRKPFSLDLASSVVRGYSFGFLLLGVIFGTLFLVLKFENTAVFTLSLHAMPESLFPSASAVLLGLRTAILNEIVFRFFFISWLREKTGKLWPGLLISSALWTLVAFTLWDFPLGYVDFVWLFASYFLLSLFFGWILIKFDLLTAIVADWLILSLPYAIPFLVSSSSFYQLHSKLFYGMMSLPLVIAVIGFIRRQRVRFSAELMPAHIRRITERERMSKELEIARNVQRSLLPKENPLVEGYDIAGVCIPALEVGGDYYDFFHLGDGRLGIAIGDVSGKGVPAAIYMTLTKGILQSHASEIFSPREVLNKVNRQMYTNIERNSFVSMFYAVLDMRKHTIRFARAGHNPAILAHRSNDTNTLLQPKGIAVGLADDTKFYEFLEELEIKLENGDVLAFYTDGFTEASTKDGAEYGEERLERTISENKNGSASLIVQNIVRSVKRFVGNHPQHDDMTMVIIKVL
ncbi:SpoIIE family protein phosphatase [candidate division KSB1 bacterium]|nr:SpoIIE family protein phosphatase [candidate division KSB1 bacterium]NIR72987.1 SpoIIE family protein phosphatase [candidate division KSB1 bacterium]NIS27740.1 SpoIIE family protein phosphatase [candidate division KSB1 bacterium]NIT74588.1 SpoIIE family protein phosphatase [candidate division KSB1 bacterium]NIU28407.1 SpoIIE family protein phosphatase [candidate division KSB1 bacterium]